MMWILVVACAVRAEVEDACPEGGLDDPAVDAAVCFPCERDNECLLAGNSCTDSVLCAHEDEEHVFIEIGCSAAMERRWPAAETCACAKDEGVCRWTGEWR